MAEDALIRELSAAVERTPDALELRLHLAELLLADGRYAEALSHCSTALTQDSANAAALALLQRCSAALAAPAAPAGENATFNWSAAEEQVADIIEPAFVEYGGGAADAENERDFDVLAPSDVKLADVAGMDDVKARLELSLLGPIRNPELMRAYKVSTRGGLLLYGPPGCGKTFLAKAVSGEIGANFYPVGISDVLQQWLGNSERAVHEIFETARRNSPCVLFFDEVDALGMRRANMRGDSGLPNGGQRDTRRDGFGDIGQHRRVRARCDEHALGCRSGVAPARPLRSDDLRRSAGQQGARRDHPAAPARTARGGNRPEVDRGAYRRLLRARTLPTSVTRQHNWRWRTRCARVRSVRFRWPTSTRPWSEMRPSASQWFDLARNVVEFGNRDGTYDDLAKYMRRRKFR